jgi:hypothetical protein
MNRQLGRRQFLASCVTATLLTPARGDTNSGVAQKTTDEAGSAALTAKLQRFLWRSQSPDGSWRSKNYGVLRSGQALTPFVLHALIGAEPASLDSQGAAKAIAWIRRHLRDGCLGVADPDVLEYPVFATSFALRCMVAVHRHTSDRTRDVNDSATDGLVRDIHQMRRFLLGEQFRESRGFTPNDLAYGGWGFGGKQPPGQTGHMDLAHTRWTLQSLAGSSTETQEHRAPAQTFLRLLQKHPSEARSQPIPGASVSGEHSSGRPPFDGGFYFSPIVIGANKGRIERAGDKAHFRSYATATCDGLLALLAAGVKRSDDRARAARRWLVTHSSWEYPAGIPREYPEPWGDAVYFYHQAVRAEVYRRLRIGGDWPRQLIVRLRNHVRDDGSIANRRSPLMKEDDPILCTTLALMAATEAKKVLRENGQ